MLLLNFYLLLLGFAMINFSFCYDYILDYDSDSVPVADKFQRKSVNSKNHNHRRTEKVKSRSDLNNRAHPRQQKKDDDVLYLDVEKFLNPSEKYSESYDSERTVTANDLDSRFQEPSKKARKAKKFARRETRGNIHDKKEYYSPANRNQLDKKKIKPSHSKYLDLFNENRGAARFKPALKRDATSKTSFRNSEHKSERGSRDKARSNKGRRYSIFRKSKKQNKNNNKMTDIDKKIKENIKNKKVNAKPIASNKVLNTTKLNPVKDFKSHKQIHVCPLCKREIDNVSSESEREESNGEKVYRVKAVRSRKNPKISRNVSSKRRRTRKRIIKNANVYK